MHKVLRTLYWAAQSERKRNTAQRAIPRISAIYRGDAVPDRLADSNVRRVSAYAYIICLTFDYSMSSRYTTASRKLRISLIWDKTFLLGIVSSFFSFEWYFFRVYYFRTSRVCFPFFLSFFDQMTHKRVKNSWQLTSELLNCKTENSTCNCLIPKYRRVILLGRNLPQKCPL